MPIIRPSSIKKLQKEGTLASGEVPFLVKTEESTATSTAGNSSTVLSSEEKANDADTVEGSGAEDAVLNTNNNSANELLNGKICVKSKVTEYESSALGGDVQTEEGEGTDEGSDKEGSKIDPYERESIPWNPGTVLKQKQEIEEKMRDGSPTAAVVMTFGGEAEEKEEEEKEEEDARQTEEQGTADTDELASSKDINQSTSMKSEDASDTPSVDECKDKPGHKRTGSRHSIEISNGDCCNVETEEECAPMDTSDAECTGDKATVYTTSGKEIQLSPGLVERHKREFEQKKAAEPTGSVDQKPSSETGSTEEEAMEVVSSSNDDTEVASEPCDEAQKTDSMEEQGCHDNQGDDDQALSGDSESHEPVYPEEGSGWKVGDVRRHTMELEERMEMGKISPGLNLYF